MMRVKTNTSIVFAVLFCLLVFLACRENIMQNSVTPLSSGETSDEEQATVAVGNADWPTLRRLIDKTPELIRSSNFPDGSLLLQVAAKADRREFLEYLIEKGGDIHDKDAENNTIPFYAALNPCPAILEFLESQGISLSVENDFHETPLHWAARYSSPETVAFLLERKLAPLARSNNGTPLENALRWNSRPEIIGRMVDVIRPEMVRNLPIFHAARWCTDPDCVQILIDKGVDPKSGTTLTPLHEAATRNPNPEIIKCLVRNGANVNPFKNGPERRNSPLHRAARYNPNVEVSKTLVELGAAPDQRNAENLTPMDYAFRYTDSPDVARYFADLYEISKSGDPLNPLLIAAEYNDSPEVVADLANRLPDFNKRYGGEKVLLNAVLHSNTTDRLPVVKVLLEAGARGSEPVYEILNEYSADRTAELIKSYD